jgi:hypothetical protein
MNAALALVDITPVAQFVPNYEIRQINVLEVLITNAETDIEAMLWEQAARVVALLEGGLSQRALAREWLNPRTGKPYSQMHVSFTARAFEKFTFQPRPRFRAAYNAVANAAKRAADLQAHLNSSGADPADADLRVCSCGDLFATGIQPDAVITEPPNGLEHIHVFSELAVACTGVPFVAIRVATRFLPDVMQRLCTHLTYRDSVIRDNKLTLVFCQDCDALERAKARARTVPGPTALRPYETWEEFFIQRYAGPGELVCDPFLRAATAIAALEFGRRFVGCSVDAGVVADVGRQIGVAQ